MVKARATNGPNTPLDNNGVESKNFDRENTEALIRLLLKNPLVTKVHLDPIVIDIIKKDDPAFDKDVKGTLNN